jgi:hypothetical protein
MEDLEKWIEHYEDNIMNIKDLRFEQSTGLALRHAKAMSKDQLLSILKWRYGDQKYYFSRVSRMLESVDDQEIKEVTRTALTMSSDYYKVTLLCAIPGVGPVLASIILSFYDPHEYGVFDREVWNQLFPDEKADMSVDGYLRFIEGLRKLSKEHQVPARVLGQALLAYASCSETNDDLAQ